MPISESADGLFYQGPIELWNGLTPTKLNEVISEDLANHDPRRIDIAQMSARIERRLNEQFGRKDHK